jgi:hypothetical protein
LTIAGLGLFPGFPAAAEGAVAVVFAGVLAVDDDDGDCKAAESDFATLLL